jgi:O-antigen/teichoic acid export membrane protein
VPTPPEPIPVPARGRPLAARHGAALAAGTVVAGLAAYAYVALGSRTFGATDFAPVAVVWSFWPAAAAAFAQPLEQWITREWSAGGDGPARVGATLRVVLPVIAAICVVAGLIAWGASRRLFGESGVVYPAILTGVSLGAALMGLLRGGLAARGRYVASATATAGENAARLVAAVAVAATDGGVQAFALTLLVGPVVVLAWPGALRHPSDPSVPAGSRNLLQLAGATLLAQLVLSAPPVLLAARVGPTAAVTACFAALALLRAPYLIAVGVSVRLLPPLTQAWAGGDTERLRGWLRRIAVLTAVAAGLAALIVPVVLPPVLRFVFGDDVRLGTAPLAGLAAGVAAAHGALAASLILLAGNRQDRVLRAWIAGGVVNVAVLATSLPAATAVAVAFATAELVAVAAMMVPRVRLPGR